MILLRYRANRSSTQDSDERKYSSQLRDLELRRREQDLSLRDREATLRERELLQRQERQIETEASKAAVFTRANSAVAVRYNAPVL